MIESIENLNSPIVRNVKTEVLINLKDYSVSEL